MWQTDIWINGYTDRRPKKMRCKDIQGDRHRIERQTDRRTISFEIDE